MGDTTLVAKTRVKFGGAGHMDPKLGFVRTEEHTTVEPGNEFSIDADTAEDLIAAGAAMSPKDYEAEQRSSKSNEDRIEEMRAEVAKADLLKKAQDGDSLAINSNAHLASQEKEDAAVEAAQKNTKKTKGDDKAADKDKK